MNQCQGLKRNGERCTVTADPPHTYCWWHDPANANERARAAAIGGRARASRELTTIKRNLEDLAKQTLSGEVDPRVAAVVNQLWNTLLRAIEVERRVREQDEFAERLEQLEQTLDRQGREHAW
jgi:hypothetical protein